MFGIPIVKKQHVNVETVTLVGYDHVKAEEKKFTHAMVHFFLDDYKFEVLWNNPEPRIKKLAQYRAVLTPQYSLYTEMPMTLQLYNTMGRRLFAIPGHDSHTNCLLGNTKKLLVLF